MKVAIVGDVHLTERNPRVRIDNYLETVLGKLDYIASENDKVIILGDVFHTYANSDFFFYQVYSLMKKHEGKFSTILGNHDLFHRSYTSLPRTTVGCLAKAGVLEIHTKHFTIDELKFTVVQVDDEPDKIPVAEGTNTILLGHKYFEMQTCESESLTRKDIKRLKYDLVFLGHDHCPYPEEFYGESTLIRMGSLTRMDSQMYNKEREICYYQLDSLTGSYIVKKVPTKPVSECCQEGAFDKVNNTDEIDEVSYLDIEKAINKLTSNRGGQNGISLNEVLLEMKVSQESIDLIKEMYELSGTEYR